jgi:virulence-associated protein VapD
MRAPIKRRPRPTTDLRGADVGAPRYIANRPIWGKRVYAICFDLDTEVLQAQYHNPSWQNAHDNIKRILERHGFSRQQGSVYFGDDTVDPVRCVLAIQDVAKECAWFQSAVKDVRMLRIEENNDLLPAIEGLGPVATTPSSAPAD